MTPRMIVRRAQVAAVDSKAAVAKLLEQLETSSQEPTLRLFFCSSRYNGAQIAEQFRAQGQTGWIGCTTAGELGPGGVSAGTISGLTIRSPELRVFSETVKDLANFGPNQALQLSTSLRSQIESAKATLPGSAAFGIILVDGLSVREEFLVGQLGYFLPELPIVGGSAGDDLQFKATSIFSNGEWNGNAAAIVVVVTTLPFTIFKTQHFEPSDRKLVITSADPDTRLVREINGEPAAEEFARLVNTSLEQLGPPVFSKYPLMLSIGGEYFVRSIQKANPDGSLTFHCAIDEGLVLTIARATSLVTNIESALKKIHTKVPSPGAIICFECILRRLETLDSRLEDAVGALYARNNVVGFHTYGEQYSALHINQTLTGIAIGA